MKHFNFQNLFILDIANNHQGDVEHGRKIIQELGLVANEVGVRAAVKFQFRQLETFIHPEHKSGSSAKHVARFQSTSLGLEAYEILVEEARRQKFLTMCTPFDEQSVRIIRDMDFDAIKVASCSLNDRPLLEEVLKAKMPVVLSTGGARISELDRVVQLFRKGAFEIDFALEHCVSIYPTPMDRLELNQIDNLRARYPDVPVGWSTHEDPNDLITVQLAVAKGASLFERHVGLPTDTYTLNGYSSSPAQVKAWFVAQKDALSRCGALHRGPSSEIEMESLASLKRGVFAGRSIKSGERLAQSDVYFAMPASPGGLSTDNWGGVVIADKDYSIDSPLSASSADCEEGGSTWQIEQILLQVRGLLNVARIHLAESSKIELSHHYGLARFREFGAVIIDVINREYCKKLIIQLPRQKHPYHFHKTKEETFQVLHGDLEVEKDGNPIRLQAGDLFLVEPGAWHKFSTQDGVIFEEISTTHYNNDSFYDDPKISKMKREDRKTVIENYIL